MDGETIGNKAELREMLTEAVRNTQPESKRRPKAKKEDHERHEPHDHPLRRPGRQILR